MRSIVHIAGRPDPDCVQRCVICRAALVDRSSGGIGDWFPMGRDVAHVLTGSVVGDPVEAPPYFVLGQGPEKAVVVRCTAL